MRKKQTPKPDHQRAKRLTGHRQERSGRSTVEEDAAIDAAIKRSIDDFGA
jgi:hypothetical protein